MEFRGADGKPLPPDVQRQLQEHFRNNPPPVAKPKVSPSADSGEIVVTGQRPRGSVIGDIPPERSFSPLDIRAFGASNIGELLQALGPQVSSNRGREDSGPVTLLNGRRVSDFSEIARIPSEAIERMEVFPEELALKYGYRADQKVVNVVTFERFRSRTGQLDYAVPTEGGRDTAGINADYFAIRGDTRFSFSGEYNRSGALLEINAPIQNYIDLHRHAAVRAEVARHPAVALRLMVAHAIVGSALFRVTPEPQRAHSDTIAESVETSPSETEFDAKRRAMLDQIGFDAEAPTVTGGYAGEHGVAGLFVQLLGLPDEAVLDILAIVMAETLEVGSALIETLGTHLAVDMAKVLQPDDALLDLIKDREVLDRIVAEVAGEQVAQANAGATGKVKRGIIRDCLRGEGGRAKVEGWVPSWMAFPPAAYTERGGVGTVRRAHQVAGLLTAAANANAEAVAELEALDHLDLAQAA